MHHHGDRWWLAQPGDKVAQRVLERWLKRPSTSVVALDFLQKYILWILLATFVLAAWLTGEPRLVLLVTLLVGGPAYLYLTQRACAQLARMQQQFRIVGLSQLAYCAWATALDKVKLSEENVLARLDVSLYRSAVEITLDYETGVISVNKLATRFDELAKKIKGNQGNVTDFQRKDPGQAA